MNPATYDGLPSLLCKVVVLIVLVVPHGVILHLFSSGPQDGQSDHVGIVEKCENGIVYTIEGNSGDSCRQRQYPVGYYEILGYGIPE